MVNKDNIRIFITQLGSIIGEDLSASKNENVVKLNHPFRIMLGNSEGQVAIAGIFLGKEEWVNIPTNTCMEIDVSEGLKQMYVDYEQKLYGSIIIADNGGIIA